MGSSWYVLEIIAPPELAKNAGCLIELHTPIGVLSAGLCDPAYPGLGPLLPSGVTSSTNNAIVLMKWEAKDSDQFTIHEGEELKVYKRYCHWLVAWMEERFSFINRMTNPTGHMLFVQVRVKEDGYRAGSLASSLLLPPRRAQAQSHNLLPRRLPLEHCLSRLHRQGPLVLRSSRSIRTEMENEAS